MACFARLHVKQVGMGLAQLRVRQVAAASGSAPEEQQAAAPFPGVLPRCRGVDDIP